MKKRLMESRVRHEQKRKAERKLMKKLGSNSESWQKRKQAIATRIKKIQDLAHARALERKKNRKEKQNDKS